MKTVFVTGGSGFVGRNLIPFLIDKGYKVKALARSQKSIQIVQALGAVPVKGDLTNIGALKEELSTCTSVFHLAASVDFFASVVTLRALHVTATQELLSIAKAAGVTNFIYLGAASVAMNGQALQNINEDFIPAEFTDGYSQTKYEAEQLVLAANDANFRTIALRPPLIWGKGDPNTLPAIVEAIQKGQMMLIGGGQHRFVTCHVLNVCHALYLADQSKAAGATYFITDLETPVFKDFIAQYVQTAGVELPKRTVPLWLARLSAFSLEMLWRILPLKGNPPLYRGLVNVLGLEFTVDCKRVIDALNYTPIISIEKGLQSMR